MEERLGVRLLLDHEQQAGVLFALVVTVEPWELAGHQIGHRVEETDQIIPP